MKTTQHGQYLYKMTRWVAFNCYFVRETDGLTLIDTNFAGSTKGILSAAAQLGLPVRRIVLTHEHNDHVDSLAGLQAELPDVPVFASAKTLELINHPRNGQPVEEGERIESLEVVFSPGHAEGHIALLDIRDKTLIAGDAFQTQGGVAVAGKIVWKFPLPSMAVWNKSHCLPSAQKLRALSPSRMAVGHGQVLENPLAAMDKAIAEY